jgi:hypothetical protein
MKTLSLCYIKYCNSQFNVSVLIPCINDNVSIILNYYSCTIFMLRKSYDYNKLAIYTSSLLKLAIPYWLSLCSLLCHCGNEVESVSIITQRITAHMIHLPVTSGQCWTSYLYMYIIISSLLDIIQLVLHLNLKIPHHDNTVYMNSKYYSEILNEQ